MITPTLSGTDLIVNPVYIAGVSTSSMHPTLDVDASLAVPFWYDFDTSTITSPVIPGIGNPGSPVPYMVTNFNLYANLHLNGQLLRYGPDFEFGSVAGALRFGFDLAMDDVICLVSDYYWGVPALGGGGGGGGGGGITIASISSFGGNTVITLNVDGVLIADPAAEGVTTSFTISYGGVALPVSAVGTPSTADITLSGTWSPEPIVGDVVGVEMSGGGGGGPGILTIDAFYYDSGVNRTQFTLKLDGVPWGGTVTAPAEFVINGAAPALPLAIQQVGAAQTTFNVIGQWPSVAVGDVVQHGPYNGTASTVSCINWVNESGVVVSKITLGIALSVGNTITFGSETLTITDINNSGFNGGSVEHGYVLSGLFIATPSGGDMVNFAIS